MTPVDAGGQMRNMTDRERLWGGVLLAAYLWALPLAADLVFNRIQDLLGVPLDGAVRDAAYHYLLFALTAAVFWSYLERTTRFFWEHLWGTVRTVLLALAAFFICSELSWRLLDRFLEAENRNDLAIAGKLAESPWSMAVIVVVLAPFVEEALFRGYIFGNLREVSRAGAYAVSALAFALIHVWQFAAASRDPAYLLLAVQYVVPGLVMAWTYERSGTLWGSILLHSLINGISAARLL